MQQSTQKSSSFKEYRSVTEFPKHTQKLSREDLEQQYQELRESYRSLSVSRGQLVRRQSEVKEKLVDSCRNLQQVHFTLKTVEVEKQKLQKSLAHSVEAQRELQSWGNHLNQEIDNLTDKITATNQLIKQFEGAYEEANTSTGLLSIGRRFILIMKAAQRLLNTDIQELIQKPSLPSEDPGEEWTKEDPANTNRRLLDK